ncbi:type III secretion protein (HrpB2) [Roseateles sp. YR242]|uniref:hypothetical protein n=1 Tax=Roseateles sp. YR242 TaxID=1855305 RepID=UPI0008B17C8B|nr:hypothetical protein [Roseateles sp. YR242]SEK24935.1 type III secretion protein (HrpB2) [Roseateles sp. YR242]
MTDPIQAISAQELMKQATTSTPDLQAQAQRFEQLMAREPQPDAAATRAQPVAGVDSTMGRTLHTLDDASRQVTADMQRFVAEAPTMDLQTLTTRSMELNLQVATQGLQFTACTSVAQSSKNGLQTLMKNQ